MHVGASARQNTLYCCDSTVYLMVLNECYEGQRESIISFGYGLVFCHLRGFGWKSQTFSALMHQVIPYTQVLSPTFSCACNSDDFYCFDLFSCQVFKPFLAVSFLNVTFCNIRQPDVLCIYNHQTRCEVVTRLYLHSNVWCCRCLTGCSPRHFPRPFKITLLSTAKHNLKHITTKVVYVQERLDALLRRLFLLRYLFRQLHHQPAVCTWLISLSLGAPWYVLCLWISVDSLDYKVFK